MFFDLKRASAYCCTAATLLGSRGMKMMAMAQTTKANSPARGWRGILGLALSVAALLMLLITAFTPAPVWTIGLVPLWVLLPIFLNASRIASLLYPIGQS
jgi:hypothetical protein